MPRTSGTRPKGKGPGLHGPAKGAGYGGAETGSDGGRSKQPYEVGNTAAKRRPDQAERRAIREARVSALEDELFRIATQGEAEANRISASAKLHAIYEGQPVAKVIQATVDDVGSLSREEIHAELARLGRAGVDAGQTAPPNGLSGRLGDLVH